MLIFHLSNNSINSTLCESCRDIKNALLLPIPSSCKIQDSIWIGLSKLNLKHKHKEFA